MMKMTRKRKKVVSIVERLKEDKLKDVILVKSSANTKDAGGKRPKMSNLFHCYHYFLFKTYRNVRFSEKTSHNLHVIFALRI